MPVASALMRSFSTFESVWNCSSSLTAVWKSPFPSGNRDLNRVASFAAWPSSFRTASVPVPTAAAAPPRIIDQMLAVSPKFSAAPSMPPMSAPTGKAT